MESKSICLYVTGLFPLTLNPQGSSMLQLMSVFTLSMSNIQLCIYHMLFFISFKGILSGDSVVWQEYDGRYLFYLLSSPISSFSSEQNRGNTGKYPLIYMCLYSYIKKGGIRLIFLCS